MIQSILLEGCSGVYTFDENYAVKIGFQGVFIPSFYSFESFSHHRKIIDFHWSLSDNKSP